MGISVLSPSNIAVTNNFLHNGAMQVHQRGTSTASITTAGYYTADRWGTSVNALGTWTNSVENDAPTGSGFRKSLKYLCTTADASPAAGDYVFAYQTIEGQNLQSVKKGTADATPLTLSFWVKSNKTGTYIVELYDNDNTRSVSLSYTVNASATWEQKSIVLPADTTGVFDNDANGSLLAVFWLGAGSNFTSGTLASTWAAVTTANRAVGQTNLASNTNNYWQITGVQLETGMTASKFQFKPYADDFRDCQRYYQRWESGRLPVSGGTGNLSIILQNPEPLRAKPSAIDYNLSNANWSNGLAPTGNTWAAVDPQIAWLTRTGTITLTGVVGMGTTYNALEAYGMTFSGNPRQVELSGNIYIAISVDL